jgi:hypothetical protein
VVDFRAQPLLGLLGTAAVKHLGAVAQQLIPPLIVLRLAELMPRAKFP